MDCFIRYNAALHETADTGKVRENSKHRFCVAPMMDWTDRHERYFLRLFSRHAFLYTEMITSSALVHGDSARLLQYDPFEQPLGIQLGGSDPAELVRAATSAERAGFQEVNLNIGCPSDRVQSGRFGACLMQEPALVASCVRALRNSLLVPVTVKCRIGVNGMDSDEALADFLGTVSEAGCELFIIHARIAVLEGLSPKQNREIPPLNYPRVLRMKQAFPGLQIILNGGITDLVSGARFLDQFDGIMVGREAYQNPSALGQVDALYFGDAPASCSRLQYLERYLPYMEQQLAAGVALHHMTRHVLGLFRGEPGGRLFRRHLSENATRPGAGIQVLLDAMSYVS